MRPETGQYVGSSAGALKRGGSAGLGVITECKRDLAVERWTRTRDRIRDKTIHIRANVDMNTPAL